VLLEHAGHSMLDACHFLIKSTGKGHNNNFRVRFIYSMLLKEAFSQCDEERTINVLMETSAMQITGDE
jgi:hypothetical protein